MTWQYLAASHDTSDGFAAGVIIVCVILYLISGPRKPKK